MILLLAASLFFTEPAPVEMPRAEGWLVRDGDRVSQEDRYDVGDLWYSRTVSGCWLDLDAGRGFLLAELEFLPPSLEGKMTRADCEGTLVRADRRDKYQLLRMLNAVSPVAVSGDYGRPRQLPRGLRELRYYEGTNLHHLVCAYLPEKADHWSVAVWELAATDDREERRRLFEDKFWEELEKNEELRMEHEESWNGGRTGTKRTGRKPVKLSERELLKRDAAHSVAAYGSWHFAPGEDFVILDDLAESRSSVASLTNDLAVWRGKFAAALPTGVGATNTLCVARIYRDRADFLAAAGEDMQWSAAYWSPSRRELVACLPPDGDLAELRRTFRHEAFHQYLSYATAMIPVSPWLNEGYAQYFEDEERDTFDLRFSAEQWDEAELALPSLMMADYAQFYAGSSAQRRTNYRLAWSVAYFIEHGMREIRFDPFRDLKRDYFRALSETGDMREATTRAFASRERMELFCNEWKKFWKNRG